MKVQLELKRILLTQVKTVQYYSIGSILQCLFIHLYCTLKLHLVAASAKFKVVHHWMMCLKSTEKKKKGKEGTGNYTNISIKRITNK